MSRYSDELGDRIKGYEAVETGRAFDKSLPVYARIDGRSFSTFTRGMDRPYDERMMSAMVETTKHLILQTHALIGYTQSDEISLCWMIDKEESQPLFGGKIHKLTSVLASMAAAAFVCHARNFLGDEWADRMPHFDARVFSLPNKIEATNAFLWRTMDARKNSISSACRALYSAKQMHKVDQPRMRELMNEKGVEFEDYSEAFKWGNWLRRVTVERTLTDDELRKIPERHRPDPETLVTRSEVSLIRMPEFRTVTNREQVIFERADPITANV